MLHKESLIPLKVQNAGGTLLFCQIHVSLIFSNCMIHIHCDGTLYFAVIDHFSLIQHNTSVAQSPDRIHIMAYI